MPLLMVMVMVMVMVRGFCITCRENSNRHAEGPNMAMAVSIRRMIEARLPLLCLLEYGVVAARGLRGYSRGR